MQPLFFDLICSFPASSDIFCYHLKSMMDLWVHENVTGLPNYKEVKAKMAIWYVKQDQSVLFEEHGSTGSWHISQQLSIKCAHIYFNMLASDVCIPHGL